MKLDSCGTPRAKAVDQVKEIITQDPLSVGAGNRQQRFDPILAQPRFEGLKAILERVSPDHQALCAGVLDSDSYGQLLAKLGHKLMLTPQIHVQDAYSRLGPESGIKAVLPYHDISTQSSFPTLLNFDSSLTTTPKAAAFFDMLLGELKEQLKAAV